MKQENQNHFLEIISKIKSKTMANDLIEPIRVHLNSRMVNKAEFCPTKLTKKYANICKKQQFELCRYEKGIFIQDGLEWHQNQRKIFIWFTIAYCGIKHKKYADITFQEWEHFSKIFFNKNKLLLQFQCRAISKNQERVQWKKREERILETCIEKGMMGQWNQISKFIFFNSEGAFYKTSKQCREHWFNHMDKNKKKGLWTIAEDLKILRFVKETGKKWSKIVPILENTRTEHMTKNRFYSILNYASRIYCHNSEKSQEQIINLLIKELMSMQPEATSTSNSKLSICAQTQRNAKKEICSDQQNQQMSQNSSMNAEEEQSNPLQAQLTKQKNLIKIPMAVSLKPALQCLNQANIMGEQIMTYNYINCMPNLINYNQQLTSLQYHPQTFTSHFINFIPSLALFTNENGNENYQNRRECFISTPMTAYPFQYNQKPEQFQNNIPGL